MTDRYTLAQLNADPELADRVRAAVRAIWSGDATPTDTKVARTAVAVIRAKKKAGYYGVPATARGTTVVDGETFAVYTGVSL